MKLPNLSELDLDSNLDKFKDVEEKKSELPRKAKRKLSTEPKKSTPSKDETLSKKAPTSTESVKGEEIKRERPKLPKSQYDEDGTPILNVPDLDDVNLMGEIDRFFGEEDD